MGILLQETHSTKDEQLQIPGFNIIAAIHHTKHGIATYARSDVPSGVVASSLSTDPLQWIAAFIDGVTTINVYKPPNIPFTQLPQYPHPVIYAGDFNCQPQVPIKANKIAQQVVKNGRNATVNREFTREVNKELKEKLQGASVDFDLCSDFTVDEMQQALRSLKSGKAPGPDSIHPEFLMHLGTECQNWLGMFMTNCMQRMKIPKSWRRAKIIAILKPGKSQEEAGSYRPISLLSVCFKLIERLIYNRLLPVVDPQLPREQT